MDTEMKTEIAKRNGGIAMTILILSAFVLLLNLATADFDGSAQSAMPSAGLAFIVGLALASSLRWDRAMRFFRRTET
jgi:F0F1-type ATP synthase membrane subunit a